MADFTYERINFAEDGTYYGANDFNKIDTALYNLYHGTSASSGSKFIRKQTENMAKAMKKLRMGTENVDICFAGDSVLYGYYSYKAPAEQWVAEDCIPDNNENTSTGSVFHCKYSVKYGKVPSRNITTIHAAFQDVANRVFDNKITIKKNVYSGHTAKWYYEDYNASNSDICIINLGINDAMGAHVLPMYDKDGLDYRGDVSVYIQYMRLIIEREIEAGTAVVILTPTKQLMNSTEAQDKTDRTLIDVFEQAAINLAGEYMCPCINGNELTKNFGLDLCIDFTHYSAEGNRAVGCRLLAPFVGQSPLSPYHVNPDDYLGVNPQLDNVNIIGQAEFAFTDISPNSSCAMSTGNLTYPMVSVDKGVQVNLSGTGKIVWSFYCDAENMVVVPNIYTESEGVGATVRLDFGTKQPKLANYWMKSTTVDRAYVEPSVLELDNEKLVTQSNGKVFGAHIIDSTHDGGIMIVSKGWHTIEITPILAAAVPVQLMDEQEDLPSVMSVLPDPVGEGTLSVFGLSFFSRKDYADAVKQV